VYVCAPVTTFFLGCFAFGLLFTVASFALGAFGGHLHLHGFDVGAHGGGHDVGHGADHGHVSPFNLSTISAFLAWFGGAGYLLARYSDLAALSVIGLSSAAGVAGGGIIFVTLTKYVLPRLTELKPEDFRPAGAAARVTIRIAPGGTGEVVYTLGGNQQIHPARGVTPEAIERGTDVVVVRVEKGIAYVDRWERFAAENALPAGGSGPALPEG